MDVYLLLLEGKALLNAERRNKNNNRIIMDEYIYIIGEHKLKAGDVAMTLVDRTLSL